MQVTLDWNLLNQIASFTLSIFAIILSLVAMLIAKTDAQRSEKLQATIQANIVDFAGRISGLASVTQILERNSVIVFERVIEGLLLRGPSHELVGRQFNSRPALPPERNTKPEAHTPPPAIAVAPSPNEAANLRDATDPLASAVERASNPAIARKYIEIVRNAPGELLYSSVIASDYAEYAQILDHLISNGVLVVRQDKLYVPD